MKPRIRCFEALLLSLWLIAPALATARSYASHSHSTRSFSGTHHGGRRAAVGVPRDRHGKIKRSESAKREFLKETGYPHGRPGYVVDHIVPLARGGSDTPSNMEWQTKEEAEAKDKLELGPSKHRSRKGERP